MYVIIPPWVLRLGDFISFLIPPYRTKGGFDVLEMVDHDQIRRKLHRAFLHVRQMHVIMRGFLLSAFVSDG